MVVECLVEEEVGLEDVRDVQVALGWAGWQVGSDGVVIALRPPPLRPSVVRLVLGVCETHLSLHMQTMGLPEQSKMRLGHLVVAVLFEQLSRNRIWGEETGSPAWSVRVFCREDVRRALYAPLLEDFPARLSSIGRRRWTG